MTQAPTKPLAVAIVSGGMDSVAMAYKLHSEGYRLLLLSFDYGQRHKKELYSARKAAKALGAEHEIVRMPEMASLLRGSALTSPEVDVPHGHYAADNMALTVVPNRNAIMLAIAWGAAVARSAQVVAIGVHAGDHAVYPDCRPEFIVQLGRALHTANKGFGDPSLALTAPFVTWSKDQIVSRCDQYGVRWQDTWSCYEGGDVHCGRCGTCVERKEAFRLGGVIDPTDYGDPVFEHLANWPYERWGIWMGSREHNDPAFRIPSPNVSMVGWAPSLPIQVSGPDIRQSDGNRYAPAQRISDADALAPWPGGSPFDFIMTGFNAKVSLDFDSSAEVPGSFDNESLHRYQISDKIVTGGEPADQTQPHVNYVDTTTTDSPMTTREISDIE
jgi:7-cyano-7-deazaguanine synthase